MLSHSHMPCLSVDVSVITMVLPTPTSTKPIILLSTTPTLITPNHGLEHKGNMHPHTHTHLETNMLTFFFFCYCHPPLLSLSFPVLLRCLPPRRCCDASQVNCKTFLLQPLFALPHEALCSKRQPCMQHASTSNRSPPPCPERLMIPKHCCVSMCLNVCVKEREG